VAIQTVTSESGLTATMWCPTLPLSVRRYHSSLGCPGGEPYARQTRQHFREQRFGLDPRNRIGSSDQIDLSIQRTCPAKMILEVGYVGRLARKLFMNIDLNAVPYMFTPKVRIRPCEGLRRRLQVNCSWGPPSIKNPANPAVLIPNPAFQVQPALEALLGGWAARCAAAPLRYGGPVDGVSTPFTSCTQAGRLV